MSFVRGLVAAPLSDEQIALPLDESAPPWLNRGATSAGASFTASGSPEAGRASILGRGAMFGDASSGAVGPSDAALGDPAWTELTLAAWIYVTDTPSSPGLGMIVAKDRAAYPNNVFGMAISTGRELRAWRENAAYAAASGPIELHRWTLVAVTHDGSTARSAIDGVFIAEQAIPALNWGTPTEQAAPWRIGVQTTASRGMSGLIADVRVFSRALGEDEIMDLFRRAG